MRVEDGCGRGDRWVKGWMASDSQCPRSILHFAPGVLAPPPGAWLGTALPAAWEALELLLASASPTDSQEPFPSEAPARTYCKLAPLLPETSLRRLPAAGPLCAPLGCGDSGELSAVAAQTPLVPTQGRLSSW